MNIIDDIKKRFIRLSRGQRKVAQFVIDNPNVIVTHIASEVGQLVGVSESTVIRFCYAMDLSGYGELQEKIYNDLMEEKKSSVQNDTVFTKKHSGVVSDIMNRDVKSIIQTIELIDPKEFTAVTEWLHESQFVYILGFRHSAPAASYLTGTLVNLRKHVKQIQHDMDDIVQQLSNMDNNSLLMIVAIDHTHEDILTIAKLAKNKKTKVVAFTNSTLSSLRDYADVSFTINIQKQNYVEASTSLFSIMNALIEGMVGQNKKQYIAFQKSNEQIESSLAYLESGSRMV